jgi:two-component system LytT family response regulator
MSTTVHTAIIADDEPLAREVIIAYLTSHTNVRVVEQCGDGRSAVDAVKKHQPDILFLDVQMPGLDGFAVLDALKNEKKLPAVVFASAFDRYAIRAFEVSAVDYLLKPFDRTRFDAALKKVLRTVDDQQRLQELAARLHEAIEQTRMELGTNGWLQRFLVRGSKRILLVNAADVQWIEAAGDHTILHTATDSHVIGDSLTALEQRLDPQQFLRIHRSTIVNVKCIHELVPHFNGEYYVVLDPKTKLKLSRSYRESARRILGEIP